MEYIINIKDVEDLLTTLKVESKKANIIAQWFVKDKQPVELVAEGKVTKSCPYDYPVLLIGNKNVIDLGEENIGSNIKIYIQRRDKK